MHGQKACGPTDLTNLKAEAAERHIYFLGFERYNLMSLCGFGPSRTSKSERDGYSLEISTEKRHMRHIWGPVYLRASAMFK